MSILEEGLIMTRQAHIIGEADVSESSSILQNMASSSSRTGKDVAPSSRQSSESEGRIPNVILHGRTDELHNCMKRLNKAKPIHLRGMPGIGKSPCSFTLQTLAQDVQVYWGQLDAIAMPKQCNEWRLIPQILDVDDYASC